MPKRLRRWVVALTAASSLIVPALTVLPAASASAARCEQGGGLPWWVTPSGWVLGGNTVTVPAGSPAWMTGVVMPGTDIFYFTTSGFLSAGNQLTTTVHTTKADGNCVVHHDQNQVFIPPQSGIPVILYATFQNGNTGAWETQFVGQINVL